MWRGFVSVRFVLGEKGADTAVGGMRTCILMHSHQDTFFGRVDQKQKHPKRGALRNGRRPTRYAHKRLFLCECKGICFGSLRFGGERRRYRRWRYANAHLDAFASRHVLRKGRPKAKAPQAGCFCFWPARHDSNVRPQESESCALSSWATGRYGLLIRKPYYCSIFFLKRQPFFDFFQKAYSFSS